jgi:two-component system cell cycle sensor histidine kinase/response regulator CckA
MYTAEHSFLLHSYDSLGLIPGAVLLSRHFRSSFKSVSQTSAALTMLIGSTVLFGGWVLGISILKSILPGAATMKSNTALCFLLSGAALWFLSNKAISPARQRIGQACAAIVCLVGFLTLTQYLFGWDLRIDQLLFSDSPGDGSVYPGRMAPASALSFFLSASALLSLNEFRRFWLPQMLAILTALLALMALIGYLYGVNFLYGRSSNFTGMAVHSALTFFILSTGILFVFPQRGIMTILTNDTAGGVMARQLFPASAIALLVLGWLRMLGEHAGLYNAAFGRALMVLSSIIIIGSLILWNARSLYKVDTRRKESEEDRFRLAAIVEFSGDAIISKDLDGIITTWNKGAENLFGYAAEEIIGTSVRKLIPANLQAEETQILEKIKRGESVVHSETRRQTKDGRLIDVSIMISPIRDASGRIIGMSKMARDITARKQAEEARQASETLYRTLFEYAPDGIVIADTDSYYIDANASICRMLGYTHEELIGLHASDIVTPTELEHIEPALNTIKTSSDYHREWQFRRKDGSVFLAEVIATAMPDGNLLGMIRDITERKKVEAELRESEAQFRTMANSIPQLAWMAHADGYAFWYNQRWHDYTGMTLEQMQGWGWQSVHDPKRLPTVLEGWREAITTGQPFEMEFPLRAADGGFHMFLTRVQPVKDSQGAVVRWFGTSTDVDELKRTQDALRTSEEQLRQSQKLEAIGQLAGGIAHDFNNLLTVITGYSDLTLRDFHPDDPAYAKIQEVKNAANRAAALTRQLLAFSRKQILQPVVLDLNAVVTEVAMMLQRLIGEDIELALALDPSIGCIETDPSQLEQIIMNLTVNARDAMPQGGKLTIETKNVSLDDTYASEHIAVTAGDYVMLAISDTGIGMNQQTQAHIFEPFFTTKKVGQGTGLGLSTVYGIVKQSGGSIWIYSEPGRGTTFKIYLPRIEKSAPVAHRQVSQLTSPGGTETILLVEDEAAVRRLAYQILQTKGYTVLEAANLEEALAHCERYDVPIHMMLSDVVMPKISGPEMAKRLHRLRPEMKVLYMSGYTDDAIVNHGVLESGIAFLQKPFTLVALTKKVREVLDTPKTE